MLEILRRTPWSRRAADLPPVLGERQYLERRTLLAALGLGGLALGVPSLARGAAQAESPSEPAKRTGPTDAYPISRRWEPRWRPVGGAGEYPAQRNSDFARGDRALCPEDAAATHNNFYEFLPGKAGKVHEHAAKFEPRPWQIEISGLVEEPRTVDVDEIAQVARLEERIYRHRCVEAWSMVVPWTGIALADFVRWCKPKASARFVRFVSFDRPEQAPGQKSAKQYPWPYYEALRLDEALHPLAFLVTGIYGHGLPAQHGAPIRVAVPWKYGYKSPKSIVKVELVAEQPKTFWSDLQPSEYPFESNVDPRVPHPRWSQAEERDLGTGDKLATRYLNGYEGETASLYAK